MDPSRWELKGLCDKGAKENVLIEEERWGGGGGDTRKEQNYEFHNFYSLDITGVTKSW